VIKFDAQWLYTLPQKISPNISTGVNQSKDPLTWGD
jgi:hypothetical protein